MSGADVPPPAWSQMPSTYVVCTDDRAVHPDTQRETAKHADDRVVWDTSHSPMLSRPDLVADLLVALAAEYEGVRHEHRGPRLVPSTPPTSGVRLSTSTSASVLRRGARPAVLVEPGRDRGACGRRWVELLDAGFRVVATRAPSSAPGRDPAVRGDRRGRGCTVPAPPAPHRASLVRAAVLPARRDPEEIAELYVRELVEGIAGGRDRAGAIKAATGVEVTRPSRGA